MRINKHKSNIDAKTQDFFDNYSAQFWTPYIVLIGEAGV